MPRKYLGGAMQTKLGFITTWENEDGKTLTVHRVGRMKEQLADLIRVVVGLDPTFRLVSYSTPDTILTDLQGRLLKRPSDGRPIAKPEANVLAQVGRPNMLHPRLATSKTRRIDRW